MEQWFDSTKSTNEGLSAEFVQIKSDDESEDESEEKDESKKTEESES